MNRFLQLLLLVILLICSIGPSCNFKTNQQPNILLIISDDQAWTDYGFNNHPYIETPNLDKLYSESIAFANGYVPNYRDLQDLVKSCYRDDLCIDGRTSCDVLNETLINIVDRSFLVGQTASKRGYTIEIYYKDFDENIMIEPQFKCSIIPRI